MGCPTLHTSVGRIYVAPVSLAYWVFMEKPRAESPGFFYEDMWVLAESIPRQLEEI